MHQGHYLAAGDDGMSEKIGIVVDAQTHAVLRVIVPTRDGELSNQSHVQFGEQMLIAESSEVQSMNGAEKYVRQMFGLPEPTDSPNAELYDGGFIDPVVDNRVKRMVPLAVVNLDQSPGAAMNGIINMFRTQIEILSDESTMPKQLSVDCSRIEIGDEIKISSLVFPSGIRPVVRDVDFILVNMMAPK